MTSTTSGPSTSSPPGLQVRARALTVAASVAVLGWGVVTLLAGADLQVRSGPDRHLVQSVGVGAVLLLSLAGPITGGVTVPTGIVLALLHIAVGVVLIVGFAFRRKDT